jgi:hypothetical protein
LEPKAQYEEESQQDDNAAAGTDPWEFHGLAACSILLCFCAQECSVVTSLSCANMVRVGHWPYM